MSQNEKIVETKICKHCWISFDITDKDLEFYEKISPNFWGKKYLIPTPILCPECRQQRRLTWRNERKLYKRKCDASGKEIISIYSPDKNYTVYNQDFWWSDSWEALSYWREFDFSKSFFTQFNELNNKVPKLAIIWANNENSSYCNLSADNKNCYLISESSNNEDCFYGYWLQKSRDWVDCSFIHEWENCYNCDDCFNCNHSFFLSSCKNCYNCFFLEDCYGCKNCFWCVNIQDKEYYFFNQKLTKEKYEEKIMKIKINEETINKFNDFKKQFPKKYSRILRSENCSGGQIEDSKNCNHSFHAYDAEDCKYAEHVWRNAKDCMDVSTAGRDAELIFETINCWIGVYKNIFSAVVWECQNMSYCFSCFNSHDCFWCVGLRDMSYCILNKQYSKEEYEKLVPRIIEHMSSPQPSPEREGEIEWWEFFPSSISPFGYNETVANEYFPISLKTGLKWEINYIDREWNIFKTLQEAWERPVFKYSTYETPFPKVEKIIPASKLPENISEIPDDILNWAIECEISKKPFRIIKQELEFYRKYNLPIPKIHPDMRHIMRLKLKNAIKLYERKCAKCKKEIHTTYAPERMEIIYCEDCYNKEIY
jgi:hypothetical protein